MHRFPGGPRAVSPLQKRVLIARLKVLWGEHDRLEREILRLERRLSDADLRRIGAAAA